MPSPFEKVSSRVGVSEGAKRKSTSLVWAVAGVFALAAHGAFFLFVNATLGTSPDSATPAPCPQVAISAAPLPEEWRIRMDISDAEPLFLSTPRNYGYIPPVENMHDMSDVDGGALSAPFVPKLSVHPGPPAVLAEAPPSAPLPPLHRLLPLQFWNAAETLGLRSVPHSDALAPRRSWMRVEDFATREAVLLDGKPFECEAPLEFPRDAETTVWCPAAFSLFVDTFGPAGPPLSVPWTENREGTGNPTVDAAIRRFFATAPFHRLPPGHYRILLGP